VAHLLIRDYVNGFILRDDDGQVTLVDMGVKQTARAHPHVPHRQELSLSRRPLTRRRQAVRR